MARPSRRVAVSPGRSSQRSMLYTASAIVPIAAASVVASPAWASTGGTEVKASTARSPAASPASERVQAKTTRIASSRNGNAPARASISARA